MLLAHGSGDAAKPIFTSLVARAACRSWSRVRFRLMYDSCAGAVETLESGTPNEGLPDNMASDSGSGVRDRCSLGFVAYVSEPTFRCALRGGVNDIPRCSCWNSASAEADVTITCDGAALW